MGSAARWIETLATALYVKIDDMLIGFPDLAPERPEGGIALTLSDAELLTLAVMSALLGFTSERRWLRYMKEDLTVMFPRQIGQSGYNKRQRKAFFLFIRVISLVPPKVAGGALSPTHPDRSRPGQDVSKFGTIKFGWFKNDCYGG